MPALTVSEILRFKIFDLKNLGQDHRVQHSQWSNSIVNINFSKSHNCAFFAIISNSNLVTLKK